VQKTYTDKVKFVESAFGKGVISRSGDDIAVKCPICQTKDKKKLSISLNTWQCHCWICGYKSKSLVDMLRKKSSSDLLSRYRSDFLGEIFQQHHVQQQVEKIFEYPEGYVPIVNFDKSIRDPDIRGCYQYLLKRGVSDRDLYKYRVGISKKFPRRIFFISLDSDGIENYFVSRSIDDDSRLKYINSDLDKTQIVFNELDIDWDKDVYLIEGIFDLIKIKTNAICILGSSLSENSLLFKKLIVNSCSIVLALDSDVQPKMFKIADKLISYGCSVKIFPLYDKKDVGSMSSEEIIESTSHLEEWDSNVSIMKKIKSIRSSSIF